MFRITSVGAMLAALLMGVLPGCSVFMAASGEEEPRMEAVQRGAPRYLVERELGRPLSEVANATGDLVCTYEFEIGNEPSGGRAAMHAVLDILTIGIWEVAGTPIEALQGEKLRATVTYGSDSTVTAYRFEEVPETSGGPGGEKVPDYPN